MLGLRQCPKTCPLSPEVSPGVQLLAHTLLWGLRLNQCAKTCALSPDASLSVQLLADLLLADERNLVTLWHLRQQRAHVSIHLGVCCRYLTLNPKAHGKPVRVSLPASSRQQTNGNAPSACCIALRRNVPDAHRRLKTQVWPCSAHAVQASRSPPLQASPHAAPVPQPRPRKPARTPARGREGGGAHIPGLPLGHLRDER